MAVDGDPATAWVVGDRGDPVGHSIELSTTDGAGSSCSNLRGPDRTGSSP
jgi:hypothetical protein